MFTSYTPASNSSCEINRIISTSYQNFSRVNAFYTQTCYLNCKNIFSAKIIENSTTFNSVYEFMRASLIQNTPFDANDKSLTQFDDPGEVTKQVNKIDTLHQNTLFYHQTSLSTWNTEENVINHNIMYL